ncbi:MAG: type II toxin-antitoxin system VapC family toxin [Nitrospinae bacterium]|nr:type II toxin-antitoxin system VapC family toxin [Nitrospinota bacterium]
MRKSLLDTNILTAFLKGNQKVVSNISAYLDEFPVLTISVITYYEIIRGLKAINSINKLKTFQSLVEKSEIENINKAIMDSATDIYVNLRRQGTLIEDADILLAATSIEKELVLVTDNIFHFRRIKELRIENWL